jgi:1-acylglycerone phosphate reductase
MKPFGVRVVNIISGEVSTNVLHTDRRNKRALPEGKQFLILILE